MRYLVALLMIVSLGCAHEVAREKSEKPAKVDLQKGREFTAVTIPITVDRLSGFTTCPRQIPKADGMDWKAKLAAAGACVRAGQWTMVESFGIQMAEKDHLAPWGAYLLSLSAENRKDYARAFWMVDLALKKAPGSGLLLYQQARLKWLTKDVTAATAGFKKALELDPRLTEAQALLGELAFQANQLGEAANRFQAALGVDPDHLASLLGQAEVQVRQKDFKAAGSYLERAINAYPRSTRARLRLAQIKETFERNFPEALNAYRTLRTLERERKLDAAVGINLERKIQELKGTINGATQKISKSEEGARG
jgi:tetratricopeptide (TPR) repeat protein